MGYLICDDCGGYYKLQPGEHPEDFVECQCGGKLRYTEHLDVETEDKDKLPSITSYTSQGGAEEKANTERSFLSRMPKTLIVSILAIIAILFKLGVLNYLAYYLIRYTSYPSYSTSLIIVFVISALSIIIRRFILK